MSEDREQFTDQAGPSAFAPSAHNGIMHHYSSRLVAFEHAQPSPSSSEAPPSRPANILVWIGGLGDGLLTVPYTHVLAASMPPNWALVQPLLSSSYGGWGTGSLARDAKELGRCVEYLRSRAGRSAERVVLMGHSTGCQDCIEYLTGRGWDARPGVEGVVLQAGVSDREALMVHMDAARYRESVEVAQQWMREGRGDDVLPLGVTTTVFGVPSSARRWLSLASPDKDGDDDFFSSDLPDERLKATFGKLPPSCPALILFGEKDDAVPDYVDREALVQRWYHAIKVGGGWVDEVNGGVVPGASHNLRGDPDSVVQDLVDRVVRFLERRAASSP